MFLCVAVSSAVMIACFVDLDFTLSFSSLPSSLSLLRLEFTGLKVLSSPVCTGKPPVTSSIILSSLLVV
jgi:hypothetical protein